MAERLPGGVRAFALLLAAVLAVLIATLPVGCASSPSFDFSGAWSGKRKLPNNEKEEDPILNTIAKVELEFLPNGRFTLLEAGIPKEGTYRTDGLKAFLKVDTFMERPIEEQGEMAVKLNQEIVVEAQPDGSLRFFDHSGFDKEPVTLTRKKE